MIIFFQLMKINNYLPSSAENYVTAAILLQRSQVTSLFGADRLWKKGFTGAKVKMAIFDTGIRANHPHFRNIKVSLLEEEKMIFPTS